MTLVGSEQISWMAMEIILIRIARKDNMKNPKKIIKDGFFHCNATEFQLQ